MRVAVDAAFQVGIEHVGRPSALLSGVAAPCLIVLALAAASLLGAARFVDDTLLVDPTDSFMRVVRVLGIIEHGGWYGAKMLRDGAPDGFELHWTMPLDLLLLLLALPSACVIGWPDAVRLTAPLVGPISTMLLLLATAWSLRPLGGSLLARDTGLLLVTSTPIIAYGRLGVADHHTLQLAAIVATAGALLRLTIIDLKGRAPGWKAGAMAAVPAGLAIWLGSEGLAGVALLTGAFGLWLTWASSTEHRLAARSYATALPLVTSGALLLDPPAGGLVSIAGDRLSLPQLVGTGLAGALLWSATGRVASAMPRGLRIVAVGTAAVSAFAGWLIVFPQLIGGIDAWLPPLAHQLHWSQIQELRPVTRLDDVLSLLGLGLVGLAATAVLLAARFDAQTRVIAAVAACGLIATLVLAAAHRRFAIYPATLGVLLVALALERHSANIARWSSAARPALLRLGMVTALVAGLTAAQLAAAAVLAPSEVSHRLSTVPACDVPGLLRALPPGLRRHGDQPTVLSDVDLAPRLLYATDWRTVAGPYHRNGAALDDALRVLFDPTAPAERITAARRIDYLLLCTSSTTELAAVADPLGSGLASRLLRGEVPSWLQPIPLAAPGFQLFRRAATPAPDREAMGASSTSAGGFAPPDTPKRAARPDPASGRPFFPIAPHPVELDDDDRQRRSFGPAGTEAAPAASDGPRLRRRLLGSVRTSRNLCNCMIWFDLAHLVSNVGARDLRADQALCASDARHCGQGPRPPRTAGLSVPHPDASGASSSS